MLDNEICSPTNKRTPWNKGKLIGARPPLRPKHVWSIRTRLLLEGGRIRHSRHHSSAESSSSVGGRLAWRRGIRRQDQFRVVDDVADIFVVADEAHPAFCLLQPHQIAGLHRRSILVDRDHLAAIEHAAGHDKAREVARHESR